MILSTPPGAQLFKQTVGLADRPLVMVERAAHQLQRGLGAKQPASASASDRRRARPRQRALVPRFHVGSSAAAGVAAVGARGDAARAADATRPSALAVRLARRISESIAPSSLVSSPCGLEKKELSGG